MSLRAVKQSHSLRSAVVPYEFLGGNYKTNKSSALKVPEQSGIAYASGTEVPVSSHISTVYSNLSITHCYFLYYFYFWDKAFISPFQHTNKA
jgi:hypothetical protein